jgi:hypothetical protein
MVALSRTIVPPWAAVSYILAAWLPQMNTLALPFTIVTGDSVQTSGSLTIAAGKLDTL